MEKKRGSKRWEDGREIRKGGMKGGMKGGVEGRGGREEGRLGNS